MRRIKIGVIGTGNMGKNHVRLLKEEQGQFSLEAVYDQNTEVAEQALKAVNSQAKIAYSVEDLLERVEAVVIAAPSSLHKDLALKAAAKGVHAMVEKPIAFTSVDAKEIEKAFTEANRCLMVGHVERYNPAVSALEQVLKNQQITAVEIHRCSPFSSRIQDADVISDLMIHDIDLLCNLIDTTEITNLSAHGKHVFSDKLDFVQTLFTFKSGVLGAVTASRATEEKIRTVNIHTKDSFIQVDLMMKTIHITRRTNYTLTSADDIGYRQENITEKVLVQNFEPLRKELLTFGGCIESGKTPPTDGAQGVRAVEIMEKIRNVIAL